MLKLPLEECASKSSEPFRKRDKDSTKIEPEGFQQQLMGSKGLTLRGGTAFSSPRKEEHFEHFLSIKTGNSGF